MDEKKLPISSRIKDERDLPESKKPSRVDVLLEGFEREEKGDPPFPDSKRRGTALARQAGIADIEDAAKPPKMSRKQVLYGDEK